MSGDASRFAIWLANMSASTAGDAVTSFRSFSSLDMVPLASLTGSIALMGIAVLRSGEFATRLEAITLARNEGPLAADAAKRGDDALKADAANPAAGALAADAAKRAGDALRAEAAKRGPQPLAADAAKREGDPRKADAAKEVEGFATEAEKRGALASEAAKFASNAFNAEAAKRA